MGDMLHLWLSWPSGSIHHRSRTEPDGGGQTRVHSRPAPPMQGATWRLRSWLPASLQLPTHWPSPMPAESGRGLHLKRHAYQPLSCKCQCGASMQSRDDEYRNMQCLSHHWSISCRAICSLALTRGGFCKGICDPYGRPMGLHRVCC
jgi:hypothetical protein